MLVAILVMVLTMIASLWALGPELPSIAVQWAPPAAIEADLDVDARPTPYWRFRDEWLTPRPRQ